MHLAIAAEYVGWIVAIVGGLATLLVVLRKARRRLVKAAAKANDVSDVLLGRPAILHPETGEVLAPAAPGIGTRMAHIEKWQDEAGGILGKLADTQAQMVRTNARVDGIDDKLNAHIDAGCTGSVCPAGLVIKRS